MNKETISIFLFCCLGISAFCQNLVPNGGFEEAIECPEAGDALHFGCAEWYKSIQIPGNEMHENPSPDWYHGCSENLVFAPPSTLLGFQHPVEGLGYAGIITFGRYSKNYREVIGVKLMEPLESGQYYRVNFNIVLGSTLDGGLSTGFATNLGALFTDNEMFESISSLYEQAPQIYLSSAVSDTLNWLEMSFDFLATESFEYFHFGNFRPYSASVVEELDYCQSCNYGYYFIDDVSVELATPDHVSSRAYPEVQLYPNPSEDRVSISGGKDISEVQVFDSFGVRLKTFSGSNNMNHLDVSDLPKGIYFLHLYLADGALLVRRFVKS